MSASILLVDDEESILKSMKFALIKEGYKITTATCGEEAVELVKAKGENFDLLTTDLQMSGIGGIKEISDLKSKLAEYEIKLRKYEKPD